MAVLATFSVLIRRFFKTSPIVFSISRRTTPPCSRSLSWFWTARSKSEESFSATSRSMSRITLKTAVSSTENPAKSCPMYSLMISSIKMKSLFSPGSLTILEKTSGMRKVANNLPVFSAFFSIIARLSELLLMNGNGLEESSAIGVKTG